MDKEQLDIANYYYNQIRALNSFVKTIDLCRIDENRSEDGYYFRQFITRLFYRHKAKEDRKRSKYTTMLKSESNDFIKDAHDDMLDRLQKWVENEIKICEQELDKI